MEKHTGKKRFDALSALALVLLAVFLVSAGKVVTQLVREKREENALAELARRVPDRPARAERRLLLEQIDPGGETSETTDPPSGGDEAPEPPVQEIPTPAELYGELAAENGDFFGWVSIDGTEIDYPVMYTPKRPEYYLRRAFDKTSANSGTPFLDGRCFVGCGNYIVYGHRMRNGTMFFDLLNYADEAFWREHPIVHFDTLEEYGDYEILAAFYSRIYSAIDEDVFRYYQYTDLTEEAVFDEYLQNVRAAALYDTGVEAVFGDQLLTLSTCSYHTEDGRFVVVARKLED